MLKKVIVMKIKTTIPEQSQDNRDNSQSEHDKTVETRRNYSRIKKARSTMGKDSFMVNKRDSEKNVINTEKLTKTRNLF
jgi:hypothetical protein